MNLYSNDNGVCGVRLCHRGLAKTQIFIHVWYIPKWIEGWTFSIETVNQLATAAALLKSTQH
jgi:hypothetical protein